MTAGLGYHQLEEQELRKDSFCSTPVVKQRVEFPESLVGRAHVDFDMYSGYVNVTQEDWLFYWLFETADSNPDAPLIIWTNGGPGCSSMEGKYTSMRVIPRPYNYEVLIINRCHHGKRSTEFALYQRGLFHSN